MENIIYCLDNAPTEQEKEKMQEIIKSMEGFTLNSVLRILNYVNHAISEYKVVSPVEIPNSKEKENQLLPKELLEIAGKLLNATMIGRTPQEMRKIIKYLYDITEGQENIYATTS